MKKLFKSISACLTAVFLLSAVGCSYSAPSQTLPKLATPAVVIDDYGVASWDSVDYAGYYVYVIDEGEEHATLELHAQLEYNESIKVKAVSGNAGYADSEFSNYKTYKYEEKEKLSTPQVSIDGDGIATWGKIDGAQSYIYVIDDGGEKTTTVRGVTLVDKQSIKVKAVSGNDNYGDSDFSLSVTYVKGLAPITALPAPRVTIDDDGNAAWEAVANAQSYVYVINGGAEKTTTARTVKLEDKDNIKVKAVSGNALYKDSDFSELQTYTKKDQTHTHTDANSDGECDECGNSVKAELSFLAVNDLHGKFMDTDNQPGVDEFTAYLKNLYADTSREEVLISSGDMWQGTVESSSNKGRLMTEWMNEVGFSSMTLGNHEYDWGSAALTPNSKLAEFPFLAINITQDGKSVDYCQPSTTVEKGGVKIGIIGAIGDCLSSISGDYQNGLKFATGSELTALVKAEANRLRNTEGCDFIVYSIHDGYSNDDTHDKELSVSSVTNVTNSDMEYYDTSLSDGYVDLVFEAHTHQGYMFKDEYGVYHLQGGGENRYVSSADVSYNTVTGEYTVTPRMLSQSVYANSSLKDDPVVNQIFNKYFPDSNPYTTVLGYNGSQKNDTAICDTVARLYYETGVAEWGSRYDVVLGGGYLKTRSPYKITSGNVTYADLFSVMPFDNEIVLGKIQGRYLKSKFLQNTLSTYHTYGKIDASEVSDYSYYYIIVDSYSSTYKSNNITEVARLGSGRYARDLLADYVSNGGWA